MRKQNNTGQTKSAGKPKEKRFTLFMQKKLAVLYIMILLAFVGTIFVLYIGYLSLVSARSDGHLTPQKPAVS